MEPSTGTTFDTLYRQWREGHDFVGGLGKVFVLGCAKSGTTWLADLLDAHPHVVVRGEGGFAWRLYPILAQAFQVFNEHQKKMQPIARLRDIDLLLAARAIIDGQLTRYVAESKRDPFSIRIVGDKTPQHSVGIPLLNQLYPEARFVHLVRDPRDVATSAWFHFGRTESRTFEQYIDYFITQAWPINVQTARRDGAPLKDRFFELRYEDLRAEPAGLLSRLLTFLQVDADDAVIRACVDKASFERRSGGRRPGQKDNDSFFRSGTTGDWRNHIPVELAEACCAKIAPLMKACGYDPSCRPAESLQPSGVSS
jgi:hypothetical protein